MPEAAASRRRRSALALIVHAIPTTGLMLQGVLYLLTPRFMPYHGDALGVAWEALPANHQGFLLGVIKAIGAGSVGVALALLILLLVPFRRGDRWSRWAVPIVGATFTSLLAYAAWTIDARTPASPPWRQTLGLTLLYLTGATISFLPAREQPARTAAGKS